MRRFDMPARSTSAAVIAVVSVALAACGDSSSKPPSTAPAAKIMSNGGNKESGATADVVAKEARGKLQCPARLPPAPPAGSPIDDVLGVRPGISYEEAWNAVLCTHELLVAAPQVGRGFDLKAPEARSVRQGFGAAFAEPRVVKSSKEIMKELQADAMARGGNALREDLKPGQSRWFVSTMGVPGQERVISVAREERYAADQSPTVDATVEALLKKYGTPSHLQRASANLLPLLRWAYDPQGQLLTEGAPLFHRCQGMSDPNGSLNLVPDCGRVVQALLIPQRTNPALVDRLQVGVVDQGGGYKLIVATEQALGQTDQERRAREVEKASKNAKAPTL